MKLLGGDSRFFSTWQHYVPSGDLAAKGIWRDEDGYFLGSKEDGDRVLRELAEALNYLHAREFVHNDLKPGNVLYGPHVKLCDFGISRIGSVELDAGTPFYIPPEYMVSAIREPSADMFACGMIGLYLRRDIRLPELEGKEMSFLIADVHTVDSQKRGLARKKMGSWFKHVEITLKRLGDHNDIVRSLLNYKKADRLTAPQLVDRLKDELNYQCAIEEVSDGSRAERELSDPGFPTEEIGSSFYAQYCDS